MKAVATSSPEIVDVQRLDHLPLVGAMRRELAVKDLLDALIPPHQRHVVTVGECLEALVLTILTGEHALSRVADTLAGYDLEIVFPRPGDAAHFHDNRLGRALDALWTAGLDRLSSAVMRHANRGMAMTTPRRRMLEDLQLRGLAPKTQQCYVVAARQLAHYYRRPPHQLIDEELRQ
jgi:uncharacterized protein DUF4277/integrase-like protein